MLRRQHEPAGYLLRHSMTLSEIPEEFARATHIPIAPPRMARLLSHMAKHDPDLDLIFQALSDPTRRGMLARIGPGAVPVSELARPTGMALPTILRHLSVLEAAQLIITEKQGRTRLCRARPDTLAATADWLADQRAQWEARTDRLETYVMTLMKDRQNGP